MHGTRSIAYILCVGATIVVVIFGWIWTTKSTLVKNVSGVKKEFIELADTTKLNPEAHEKLEQVDATIESVTNFVEKKETVSKSLVENLKQRIEKQN
jgi:hypothetical protein